MATKAANRVRRPKWHGSEAATAPVGMALRVKDIKQLIAFYEKLGCKLDAALLRADGQLTVVFLSCKQHAAVRPTDEVYGDRVIMFLDPDGDEWKISQTIQRVDLDEVAEIVAQS